MTGQYSCNYNLYLRSCTGTNAGDECTPNNYYTSSSCQPRVNYIHNCIHYFDTTIDLVTDPACTACVDGR